MSHTPGAARKRGVVSLTPRLLSPAVAAGDLVVERDQAGGGIRLASGVGVEEGAVPLWKARDILLDAVNNAGERFFQEVSLPSLSGVGADKVFWIRLEVRG